MMSVMTDGDQSHKELGRSLKSGLIKLERVLVSSMEKKGTGRGSVLTVVRGNQETPQLM